MYLKINKWKGCCHCSPDIFLWLQFAYKGTFSTSLLLTKKDCCHKDQKITYGRIIYNILIQVTHSGLFLNSPLALHWVSVLYWENAVRTRCSIFSSINDFETLAVQMHGRKYFRFSESLWIFSHKFPSICYYEVYVKRKEKMTNEVD